MDDLRLEHLKMIQAVIARMAQNSFLIKGWSVTLVTAVMAITLRDSDRGLAFLALYPALAFWGLDAFYMRQERLFRALYDSVRASGSDSIVTFSFATNELDTTVPSWERTLFARTVLPLHGTVVFLVLVLTLVR